jgi:hypothetical protein
LQLKGDPGDLKFFQLKERLCRQKWGSALSEML